MGGMKTHGIVGINDGKKRRTEMVTTIHKPPDQKQP